MLKFCPECGSKTNGGKFCGGCGADLSKYGESGASSVDINANSTLDDAIGNLLDLAKDRQMEDKLRVLIIRGKYEEARQLCDELIDKNPMDKVGYTGLIRIASKNYKVFEGEELKEDIRIAQEIFGKEELLYDAEYANFESARKQYLEEKVIKLKEQEELKRREEEEEHKKLKSFKIKVGDFVNFGRWPQSKKANDIIIERMDDNGYYVGSDGYQYAKVGCDYFKVENIKWKILKEEEDDGKILLLCNSVIEVKAFDKNRNEYDESDIRKWLNKEFYSNAFANTDKKLIVTTSVDNGIESQKEQYVANNTFDNIFLLSWNEVRHIYESQIYGVGNYPIVTEYIKAKNAYKKANGYNWWWLRTTSSKDRAYISDGPYSYNKDYEFGGVVPVLWFQFDKKH